MTDVAETVERRIAVPAHGTVSSVLVRPESAEAMLVLAHGAGAGMRHPFMERVAASLARHHIATLRYQFPYMEAGRKRPDRPAVATAAVRAAVESARGSASDLPLVAGGKSFGGRMTSTADAAQPLAGVRGLVFFGFPLHAPRRPDVVRGAHLQRVALPMLFLQGTRDPFADLSLLQPLAQRLAEARVHVVNGADHAFALPARAARSADAVLEELAAVVASWVLGLAPQPVGRR